MVSRNLATFIMDNAIKNDIMIRALGQHIPSIDCQQRLRCADHILKLVVKAILYGKGLIESNKNIIGCSDTKGFGLWRKVGAIQKIQNTVKCIMRSDQRRQLIVAMRGQNQEGGSDDGSIYSTPACLSKMEGCAGTRVITCSIEIFSFKLPSQHSKTDQFDKDVREIGYSAVKIVFCRGIETWATVSETLRSFRGCYPALRRKYWA